MMKNILVRNFVSLLLLLSVMPNASPASAATVNEDCLLRNLLPPIENWPHRPVFVKASDETVILGVSENEALPVGVPFEFETTLFRGRMLLRMRNTTSEEIKSQEAYFPDRTRLMQTVVQGRFKKSMKMDELYMGSVFQEPLRMVLPGAIRGMIQTMMNRVAPGVVMDLTSEKPKIVTLYAGGTQTLSVNLPGEEPDIMAVDIPENTSLIGKMFKTSNHRKKHLSVPSKAANHQFDTEHIYTFNHYDHAMDYAKYTIKLPLYEYDLSKVIGPQPMSLSAVTTSGEIMFHFDIWHESVYKMQFP